MAAADPARASVSSAAPASCRQQVSDTSAEKVCRLLNSLAL